MKTQNLIILTLLAVFIASCDGKELGRCDLTEAQKRVIPYEKGQVIGFTDSAGLPVSLTVTESNVSWVSGRPDGEAYDYNTWRRKAVRLKSEANDIEISLYTDATCCFDEIGYNIFRIDFRLPYQEYFPLPSDVEGNLTGIAFYDSLEINNKVYYEVCRQDNYHQTMQLFYNKTYGILQIKKDGADYLTLNP